MKVYRGPKSKELDDFSHELVDTIEIIDIDPWSDTTRITINLTKDPNLKEKHAVATLYFTESDIENLYLALIRGRIEQKIKINGLRKELDYYESVLNDLDRVVSVSKLNTSEDLFSKLKPILNSVFDRE